MKLAVLACIGVAACTPRFDLDEPIAILVTDELDIPSLRMVANAAACWQQEFSIPFDVTDTVTGAGYLIVVLDELTCVSLEGGGAISMGRFYAGRPAKMSLCPYGIRDETSDSQAYYFRVVLHELGHAAGIYAEGTEQSSVMGSAQHLYQGNRVFSDEDHALLEDAVGERPASCIEHIEFGPLGTSCRCPEY